MWTYQKELTPLEKELLLRNKDLEEFNIKPDNAFKETIEYEDWIASNDN